MVQDGGGWCRMVQDGAGWCGMVEDGGGWWRMVEDVQRFEQLVHRSRPIQSGQDLFRSGDEFRSVASVRTGCFKSYLIDHNGQEQVLDFHLPGDIVGLDAIHSRLHKANVVALDTNAWPFS